jgi:hypothetical protein
MNAFELSEHIAARLDEDQLEYAIGGALALTAWAIPRDTHDVDISVFAAEAELPRVIDALERSGVMVDRADAVKSVSRIGMFTGRAGRTLVDVFISTHPHFLEMRNRRQRLKYPSGATLWFLSAEDLTVMKLLYGRTKDIADLERMFSALTLDLAYVRLWLAKMVPVNDRRLALVDDLETRFIAPRHQ